jgi:hypothetical protein
VGFDGDYFGSKEVAGLFRSDRVRMSIDSLHICLMRKSIKGSAFSSNIFIVSCSDYCSRPIFTTIRGMDGGGDPRDPRDILPVWFHYGG